MMSSRVSVVITRLLMTWMRWSAYEVTVERTRSRGISCCSISIVPCERYCGGQSSASSTEAITPAAKLPSNQARRRDAMATNICREPGLSTGAFIKRSVGARDRVGGPRQPQARTPVVCPGGATESLNALAAELCAHRPRLGSAPIDAQTRNVEGCEPRLRDARRLGVVHVLQRSIPAHGRREIVCAGQCHLLALDEHAVPVRREPARV